MALSTPFWVPSTLFRLVRVPSPTLTIASDREVPVVTDPSRCCFYCGSICLA
jgi:hypothetical protein